MAGPRTWVAVGPFDEDESAGDEAVGPTKRVPVACLFEAIEVPVFDGEESAVERLAEGEGRAGDRS